VRAIGSRVMKRENIGFAEAAFGVEWREFILETQRRIANVAEAAPIKSKGRRAQI
jgi:hypothetical protein